MSRAYLQALPEETRQEKIRMEINHHYVPLIRIVQEAAIAGKTSYLYNPNKNPYSRQAPPIPIADLVEGFKLKFPGCTITCADIWVLEEQSPHNRQQTAEKFQVLTTGGIRIDWS
jgi:hypothetical protein